MNNNFKSLSDFINESLKKDKLNESENEGIIKTEKDFREYAENKFEEVFGDDLDEDKMNKTIDGILKDNPVPDNKKVEDLSEEELEEYWGELIGILNKSFGD